jgi:hypothetical protein
LSYKYTYNLPGFAFKIPIFNIYVDFLNNYVFFCLSSQLLEFGVRESVINVSAVNAVEFRFSAWDYYRFVNTNALN